MGVAGFTRRPQQLEHAQRSALLAMEGQCYTASERQQAALGHEWWWTRWGLRGDGAREPCTARRRSGRVSNPSLLAIRAAPDTAPATSSTGRRTSGHTTSGCATARHGPHRSLRGPLNGAGECGPSAAGPPGSWSPSSRGKRMRRNGEVTTLDAGASPARVCSCARDHDADPQKE